jgi:hypothetical protein
VNKPKKGRLTVQEFGVLAELRKVDPRIALTNTVSREARPVANKSFHGGFLGSEVTLGDSRERVI